MIKIRWLLLVVLSIIVSSCGGGGSDTSSSQYLTGITYDTVNGKLYVVDNGLNIVQSASALTGTATLTTIAGTSGTSGSTNSNGTSSNFYGLAGVVADSTGNLFLSEINNNSIRKITSPTSTATATTFAGSIGTIGSTDGTSTAAYFYNPRGLAIDSSNNIYVADTANNSIRKITSAGVVSTLAGYAGTSGATDATSSSARFNNPFAVATDGVNVYVADSNNNLIRKIVISSGVVTTLAGNANGSYSYLNATGTSAYFNGPIGIATDGTYVFVTDYYNHAIRQIVIASGVVTTLAGSSSGSSGYVNAVGTSAQFSFPLGITYYSGNLYITDQSGTRIRVVSTSTGSTSTLY